MDLALPLRGWQAEGGGGIGKTRFEAQPENHRPV